MARTKKQPLLPFSKKQIIKKLIFGGDLLKNSHAKGKRPLAGKQPMHLVLRSSIAKGKRSMLYYKNQSVISEIVYSNAKKLGINIIDFVNVGNHLHIIIKLNTSNPESTKYSYCRFIRAISGLIARVVLNVQRGKRLGIKFWDQRPFTRIVDSWTALKILKNYILKNLLQTWGMPPEDAPLLVGYQEINGKTGFD